MFPRVIGSCTTGKSQRISASSDFFQHAKLNMAGFVLYLLDDFALRCRMVGFHSKTKKKHSAVSPQHSAKRTQKPEYNRGRLIDPERKLMPGTHSRGHLYPNEPTPGSSGTPGLCHKSIAETYANLGSPGMRWDTQGGGGVQDRRDRRHRKHTAEGGGAT
jgi:hypothetical protein